MSSKLIFAVIFVLMLAAGAAQAGGNAESGKKLSVDCADCHGADGMGDEDSPKIAGLDAAYQIEQLKGYRSGQISSEDDVMLMYTEDLTDQDIEDLAAYYSGL